MADRKLATIRRIKDIRPIEGADLIEIAFVDGWQCVIAKKDNFKIGSLCIYCEIDSLMPEIPEFEFLRDKKFRIKTIKLRGQLSQGIIFPINILKSDYFNSKNISYTEGEDLTDALGVKKFEPPIPPDLVGKVRGMFPSQVPKTDEERIQNLVNEIEIFSNKNLDFVGTEKLDGTSATYILLNDDFHVCSRTLDLLESETNIYWKIARNMALEEKMRKFCQEKKIKNFAMQGELIGEGIQKNKYKLKGNEIYFFHAYNIDRQRFFNWDTFQELIKFMNVKQVPLVFDSFKLESYSIPELLQLAEGKSLLNKNIEREGIIFKAKDLSQEIIQYSHLGKISFKVINNRFLLKYEE